MGGISFHYIRILSLHPVPGHYTLLGDILSTSNCVVLFLISEL